MPTAAETFYKQDYLDLNDDVAKHAIYGKDPVKHWEAHGKFEIKDGLYNRRWNKQVPDRQPKPPTVFLDGSSKPEEPVKKSITKVVSHFSDGTTKTVNANGTVE